MQKLDGRIVHQNPAAYWKNVLNAYLWAYSAPAAQNQASLDDRNQALHQYHPMHCSSHQNRNPEAEWQNEKVYLCTRLLPSALNQACLDGRKETQLQHHFQQRLVHQGLCLTQAFRHWNPYPHWLYLGLNY